MNKEEFNLLGIVDQVKAMNEAIKEAGSVRKATEMVGISKTTIRDRFRKYGYLLQENEYVKTEAGPEAEAGTITKVEQEQEQEKAPAPAEPKKEKQSKEEQWKKDLGEILKFKNEILEMVNTYKSQQEAPKPEKFILRTFSTELQVKSMKIYKEALDKLQIFLEANRNIKQQDIFSQAILEFLEKYTTEDKDKKAD
jgi:molybdenum-dependent DNA-binding transcriptional regulator ModE